MGVQTANHETAAMEIDNQRLVTSPVVHPCRTILSSYGHLKLTHLHLLRNVAGPGSLVHLAVKVPKQRRCAAID